jgi:hypothetical protein
MEIIDVHEPCMSDKGQTIGRLPILGQISQKIQGITSNKRRVRFVACHKLAIPILTIREINAQF